MSEPLHVTSGELSVEEILDALRDEQRIVVETEVLGSSHEITLRYDGSVYYCDTPTKLHTHEEESEMRECILTQGYGADDE